MKRILEDNKSSKVVSIVIIFLVMTSFIFISSGYIIGNTASASTNFIHPNMYLNSNEIESIKEKVASGKQPWKSAYDKMISDANGALNTPIQSVTYGGPIPPSGDIHDYYTDPPYSSDGVYDPNADRTDYNAAIKLGKSVRVLGLAYAFTGDDKYAEKAVQLVSGWTVDPTTKMNPKLLPGQAFIEIRITMPGMFYGADLIWNYPGWSASDKIHSRNGQ